MKKLFKILIRTILVILFFALVIYLRPACTPRIPSEKNYISIASLEKIELGDFKQSVLIRTKNVKNPILLFTHGGPGMPIMYLSYRFQRELEGYFTVVQWDQRGAGKSYDSKLPISSINVEQYISDALQLIDTLQRRFNQKKLFLAGHSWGTYLSSILVSRHPDLFYAYISVGQVVDGEKSDKIKREFLLSVAQKDNDTALISRLRDPEYKSFESWLFKYGGELKKSNSFLPLIITGILSPEYTFRDALNVAKGPQLCGKYMNYNAIQGSIFDNIRDYEVPVFFITGTHDYTTPYQLTKQYFDSIHAPVKELILFNESAHFPFYEEPKRFDSVLVYQILKSILK